MKIKDIVFVLVYISFGVLTRTVWHIAPNVEFVTALCLAGAFFMRKNSSYAIPLGIMIVSDLIIGNSPVFIFTWSAFGSAHLLGKLMRGKQADRFLSKVPAIVKTALLSELAGIVFTVFFFLWTNFGVVLVSNLYPKTLEGLLLSYEMGVPFLIPQLIGNMIIVPAVFVATELAYNSGYKYLKNVNLKLLNR
ncbi:MAG: DUF6580 family putative transport protein [Patescibacteria group bacterium]|nr:hypothetical protein [Patescibacteria group bacterium]